MILINVADISEVVPVSAQVLALNSPHEHAAWNLLHYILNTMWPTAEHPSFYLSFTPIAMISWEINTVNGLEAMMLTQHVTDKSLLYYMRIYIYEDKSNCQGLKI